MFEVKIGKEEGKELSEVIDIEVDFVLNDIGIVSLLRIIDVEKVFEIKVDIG